MFMALVLHLGKGFLFSLSMFHIIAHPTNFARTKHFVVVMLLLQVAPAGLRQLKWLFEYLYTLGCVMSEESGKKSRALQVETDQFTGKIFSLTDS